MNNFKIYSDMAGILEFKLSVDNNEYNIIFENDRLKFDILDCDNEQIKINLKNYFFCENPICNTNCPVSEEHAICIKSNYSNINSEYLNHCECLPGWKGYYCQTKDYAELKYVNTNSI